MSLSSELLFLEPNLHDKKVDLHTVIDAWDEVKQYSVEVAFTYCTATSVFEFATNECIFFASINHWLVIEEGCNTETVGKRDYSTNFQTNTNTLTNSTISVPAFPSPPRLETHDWSTKKRKWQDDSAEGDFEYGNLHKRSLRTELRPLDASSSKVAPQVAEAKKVIRTGSETVGIIYLTPGQFGGEVNVGLALAPSHRGKGFGNEAVGILLKWAFDAAHYHRVQVALLEGPGRDRASKLFTNLGFAHEGTRRRQVLSAFSKEYKDVTYMAIIDTEWSIRNYFNHAPNSLWDELFQRHQCEREELLRWDGRRSKLKTQSMETIRMAIDEAPSPIESTEGEENCLQETTDNASLEHQGELKGFHFRSPMAASVGSRKSFLSFSLSPSPSMPPNSLSPEESRDAESDCSADELPIESHHVMPRPLFEEDDFEVGAAPPPPSEADSELSGWEMTSESGGSSSESGWDKCSVASSG